MQSHRKHDRWARAARTTVWLLAATALACGTNAPSSPTSPGDLTGQNPNEGASFRGTISVAGSTAAVADGATDAIVVAQARDEGGNPVQNGTPISFSTSLGTIRAVGSDPAGSASAVQVTSWGGEAAVAVRSSAAGDATIVAGIASVQASTAVRFNATAEQEIISLALLSGSSPVNTLDATSPADIPLRALVTDVAGAGLPNRTVRFQIVKDTTSRLARAGATLLGAKKSETNSAGEAFNVLAVRGTGSVVLEAELLQSNTVVGTSNQVVANITTSGNQVVIALAFDTGKTVESITNAGASLGMIATVTDKQTGQSLGGRRVRFEIIGDTATGTSAELTTGGSTFTNGAGEATNAVTVFELGSRVAISSEVLDENGAVEAISNQIIVTSVIQDAVISLTFDTSTTFESEAAPINLGLIATIRDRGNSVFLAGERVRFLIIEDTAAVTPAVLGTSQTSLTDSAGEATNSVTASEALARVTVVAEWLDANGNVIQRSNQVVLATE